VSGSSSERRSRNPASFDRTGVAESKKSAVAPGDAEKVQLVVSRIGSMACRQSRIWLVLRDHAAERDPPVLSLPPSPPRFRARRQKQAAKANTSTATPSMLNTFVS
jgi:hypothetical protein